MRKENDWLLPDLSSKLIILPTKSLQSSFEGFFCTYFLHEVVNKLKDE